ncbi:MAG: DNA polymerase-3 subunit gamma/tau [Gammaproteobacteria bacterium]|jgi:DNA polymerase-3 subunit gamma/tau
MSYQVLARKWRPASFDAMVGQEHVLQALINALDSDRLHHAYLFSGTRGVGKTTIARIFAKSLNCEQGVSSKPCGQCSSCLEVDQGRSVDLIEIDAASRTGVDDMRELLDNVQYAPTRGRFKVYLIDEVHMLSRHSFNALLKTLEEPPEHIKFLLATTDPQKLPVTVLSRCLQFNLKRMSRAQLLSQLQFLVGEEKITADASALAQLASAADGSMRDALSLLDQAIAYGGGTVVDSAVEAMLGSISSNGLSKILKALAQQDAVQLISEARSTIENNPDFQRVCADLMLLLQQVALYRTDAQLVSDNDFNEDDIKTFAAAWSAEEIQLYYQIVMQGRQDLLISPDEAAGFEMLMLRLLAFTPYSESDVSADELKKKPVIPDKAPPGAPPKASVEFEVASTYKPVVESPQIASDLSPPPLGELQQPNSATSKPRNGAVDTNSGYRPTENVAGPEYVSTPEYPTKLVSTPPIAAVVSAPERDSVAPMAVSLEQISNIADPVASAPQAPAISPSDDSLGWSELAYDLGLEGLALQIAANSVVALYEDARLKLEIEPDIYELSSSVIVEEICQAINHRLELSLTLELAACETIASETPLQTKERRDAQERIDAIASIKNEAVVRKLHSALGTELDEISVAKIDRDR